MDAGFRQFPGQLLIAVLAETERRDPNRWRMVRGCIFFGPNRRSTHQGQGRCGRGRFDRFPPCKVMRYFIFDCHISPVGIYKDQPSR